MPRSPKFHIISWIGFLTALLSLLIASVLIFTFNTIPLWKLTLAVSEYGHRLAIGPLLLLLLSWRSRRSRLGLATLVTASLALLILWVPLLSAVATIGKLPSEWERTFGGQPPDFTLNTQELFTGKWVAKSATSAFQIHTYSKVQDSDLHFYRSTNSAPSPCLIVIHGGGWQSGSPDEFQAWNEHWTAQGYAVAAIEYRLAPQNQWPAPLEDVEEALRYLKANADDLGIRKNQFVLLGRSAGGQIATAASYGLQDPTIIGCISLYAPADLFFAHQYADPNDILDSLKLLRQYVGGDPEQQSDRYTSASGILLVTPQSPPTLIIHGQRDVLVWRLQSERLAEALRLAKVPHFYLRLPWATHGFDFAWQGPGSQISRQAIDHFLKSLKESKNQLTKGMSF
jgi:acetyl esterase/lipase